MSRDALDPSEYDQVDSDGNPTPKSLIKRIASVARKAAREQEAGHDYAKTQTQKNGPGVGGKPTDTLFQENGKPAVILLGIEICP